MPIITEGRPIDSILEDIIKFLSDTYRENIDVADEDWVESMMKAKVHLQECLNELSNSFKKDND